MQFTMLNAIRLVESKMKEMNIEPRTGLDPELLSKRFNMPVDQIIYILLSIILVQEVDITDVKNRVSKLEHENRILNNSIKNIGKGHAGGGQAIRVKSGIPISKEKMTVENYELFHDKFGLSDKDIMERFGISRTTMWRVKKRAQGIYKDTV